MLIFEQIFYRVLIFFTYTIYIADQYSIELQTKFKKKIV